MSHLAVMYRALSLKQPWAALLVAGRKTIEVRRWRTALRGPVLIHAARVDDDRPEAWALVTPELREPANLRGGIIGVGRLVEVRTYDTLESFSADKTAHRNELDWFEPAGLFGFRFEDLRPLPFHAVPGFVRMFTVEMEESLPAAAACREPTS